MHGNIFCVKQWIEFLDLLESNGLDATDLTVSQLETYIDCGLSDQTFFQWLCSHTIELNSIAYTDFVGEYLHTLGFRPSQLFSIYGHSFEDVFLNRASTMVIKQDSIFYEVVNVGRSASELSFRECTEHYCPWTHIRVEVPNNLPFTIETSKRYAVAYVWSLTAQERNRLHHALHGNGLLWALFWTCLLWAFFWTYVWSMTMRAWQKLMHALHGNGTPNASRAARPSSAFHSTSIPMSPMSTPVAGRPVLNAPRRARRRSRTSSAASFEPARICLNFHLCVSEYGSNGIRAARAGHGRFSAIVLAFFSLMGIFWAYVWAMTMRAWQHLMHALHGNGSTPLDDTPLPRTLFEMSPSSLTDSMFNTTCSIVSSHLPNGLTVETISPEYFQTLANLFMPFPSYGLALDDRYLSQMYFPDPESRLSPNALVNCCQRRTLTIVPAASTATSFKMGTTMSGRVPTHVSAFACARVGHGHACSPQMSSRLGSGT